MIHPRRNRVDYGAELSPPPDCRFDQAVATTYSLDLLTLLAVPLALHYRQDMSGEIGELPCELLDAVSKTIARVRIYHQYGKISWPSNYNRLLALFDQSLVAIQPKEPFQSFHPKVWLIRYLDSRKQPYFRLLVMSRNLTDSRDWDISVSFDGQIGTAAQPSINDGLLDMCRDLLRDDPDSSTLNEFCKQIPSIEWSLPTGCESASFHWSSRNDPRPPLKGQSGSNLLCISPFIDHSTLKMLCALSSNKRWLIGRAEELNQLPRDYPLAEYMQVSVLNPVIENDASGDDEGGQPPRASQIHAKLLALDQSQKTRVVLGSANATQAAWKRNTEAFAELLFPRRQFSAADYAKQLFQDADLGDVFIPWHPPSDDIANGSADAHQQCYLHKLLACPLSARATLDAATGLYQLEIDIDLRSLSIQPGVEVAFAPLHNRGSLRSLMAGEQHQLNWRQIKVCDLSRYFAWHLRWPELPDKRFVVTVDVSGFPDDRNSHIVRALFDSEEKFLRYCRFLLLPDEQKHLTSSAESSRRHAGASSDAGLFTSGMFEEMLTNASQRPERLNDIGKLIEQLQADEETRRVIPGTFLQLWERFAGWLPAASSR